MLIPRLCSLPAAIATYGLSLGIARIDDTLPDIVYALLTGLNAATVGIIALAAVQLSQKAITDKLTRILVFMGGTAGMLYNALWYFPILMVVGGVATVLWDYRVPQKLFRRPRAPAELDASNDPETPRVPTQREGSPSAPLRRHAVRTTEPSPMSVDDGTGAPVEDEDRRSPASLAMRVFSWKLGIAVIVCFFVTFTTIMVLRGVLKEPPRGFSLLANLYLAGLYNTS